MEQKFNVLLAPLPTKAFKKIKRSNSVDSNEDQTEKKEKKLRR